MPKHRRRRRKQNRIIPRKEDLAETELSLSKVLREGLVHCLPSAQSRFMGAVMSEFYMEDKLLESVLMRLHPIPLVTSLLLKDKKSILANENLMHAFQKRSLLRPQCVKDIEKLDDQNFWMFFHVSKELVKKIVANFKEGIPGGANMNTNYMGLSSHPIEKIILFNLWYLRDDRSVIIDAVDLFHFASIEEAQNALEWGFKVIGLLGDHAGLLWPRITNNESSLKSIKPAPNNLIGVLEYQKFETEVEADFSLLAVCNHAEMFCAVETSFETEPIAALSSCSSLVEKITALPPKYWILAGNEFSAFPLPKEKELSARKRLLTEVDPAYECGRMLFNTHRKLDKKFPDHSLISYTVARFPKILCLHDDNPRAIIAACILHNYCVLFNDETPVFPS